MLFPMPAKNSQSASSSLKDDIKAYIPEAAPVMKPTPFSDDAITARVARVVQLQRSRAPGLFAASFVIRQQ